MSELSLNFEEMLNNTALQDIPDAPDFVSLPTGVWKVRGVSTKIAETTSGNPKVGVTFAVQELVESNDESAANIVAGSLVYISFSRKDPAETLSQIKKALQGISEGKGTITEVLESIADTDFVIAVQQSANAQAPERPFVNLVEIAYA